MEIKKIITGTLTLKEVKEILFAHITNKLGLTMGIGNPKAELEFVINHTWEHNDDTGYEIIKDSALKEVTFKITE